MLIELYRMATGAEDPSVTAARVTAESAERVARMNARAASQAAGQERLANRRAQAVEMAAMRESIREQRQAAALQREQAERLGAREELSFVIGEATKDTYEKVSNAFVSWAQSNNIAEEQALRAQFGLNEDHRFDSPIQEPNMYDMMNVDLLTGQTVGDDNPYQLSSDADREMDQYVNQLYPDGVAPADDIRDQQLLDLINEWNDNGLASDLPADPDAELERVEEE